jgi:ESCRT-II complex subunit VPS36
MVIGNAFEDLEALMASAKQIVALAETLARESGMTPPNVVVLGIEYLQR